MAGRGSTYLQGGFRDVVMIHTGPLCYDNRATQRSSEEHTGAHDGDFARFNRPP